MEKLIQEQRELLEQLEALIARKGSVTISEVTHKVIELGGGYSAMVALCQRKISESMTEE